MQFTLTENYKSPAGLPAPELTKQVNMLDIYLERDVVTLAPADTPTTSLPDGIEPNIRIRDGKHSKVLVLLPEKKQYFNPANFDFASDYIDLLKRQQGQSKPARNSNAISQINPSPNTTRLPLKTVDGQVAMGQHFVENTKRGDYIDTREGTLWLGPFTMQIVRGEISLSSTDPSVGHVDYVIHDVSQLKPVDRALFDLTPPAGYTELEKPAPILDKSGK